MDCLESDKLPIRANSRGRRDLVVFPVTVWLLATFDIWVGGFVWLGWFVSDMTLVDGCDFLACATARGPAHCGKIGRPTLANTKLASTVTGKIFSLIFSCRAVSASPNTICCTLLYTLRQVWKAPVWGLEERSWR